MQSGSFHSLEGTARMSLKFKKKNHKIYEVIYLCVLFDVSQNNNLPDVASNVKVSFCYDDPQCHSKRGR